MNRHANADVGPHDAHILHLLGRAVNGVMRHAQAGNLPLSTWTLGLPQGDLCALLSFCFPELTELERLPAHQYDAIEQQTSREQRQLANLLQARRTASVEPRQARWAAHVIAAAAQGSSHLWEDMGLGGREEVSALLQYFFEPFYAQNVGHVKWKRFMFDQLVQLQPTMPVRKPDCSQCAQQLACFPVDGAAAQ